MAKVLQEETNSDSITSSATEVKQVPSAFTPASKYHNNSWRLTLLATSKNYCGKVHPKKSYIEFFL